MVHHCPEKHSGAPPLHNNHGGGQILTAFLPKPLLHPLPYDLHYKQKITSCNNNDSDWLWKIHQEMNCTYLFKKNYTRGQPYLPRLTSKKEGPELCTCVNVVVIEQEAYYWGRKERVYITPACTSMLHNTGNPNSLPPIGFIYFGVIVRGRGGGGHCNWIMWCKYIFV